MRALIVLLAVCAASFAGCGGEGGSAESDAPGGAVEAAQAEGIDLSPRYEPGAGGVYEHVSSVEESRQMTPGGEGRFEARVSRRFEVRVEELLEGGGARVRFSMRRFALHVLGTGQPEFRFDTDMPGQRDEDALIRSLRALAALEFHAEVDAAGKVQRLDGYREALIAAPRAPARAIDFYDENWFVASIEAVWSAADGVTRREVGEQWRRESVGLVGETGVEATTVLVHRLASAEGGVAVIEGEASVEMNFDTDALVRREGSHIADQSYDFKKRWSLADGRLEGYETDQWINFVIDFSGIIQDVRRRTASTIRRVEG